MKMISSITLILLNLIITTISQKLKYVYSSIRHGARYPEFSFEDNKDIFGIDISGNKGELTKKGEEELYKLGLLFNEKYRKDLNLDDFSLSNYKFNISYYNRTQLSFKFFYKGLLKHLNNTNTRFNTNHNIEIINKNDFLFFALNKCKGIWEFTDRAIVQNLKDFMTKYKEIFNKYINSYDDNNPSRSHEDIFIIWDTFISDYYLNNNLTLVIGDNDPSMILEDILYYRTKEFFYFFLDEPNNKRKVRLCLSYLMKGLIKQLEFKVDPSIIEEDKYTIDYPKMFFNVAHDIQISLFTVFILDSFADKSNFNYLYNQFKYIEYASSINFELRQYGLLYKINVVYNLKSIIEIDYSLFINKAKEFVINEEDYNDLCFEGKINKENK